MTKTNETQTTAELIFLVDQHEGSAVLVAKDDWFKTMRISETFTEYGNPVEVEYPCEYCDDCDEDCEGSCEECAFSIPTVRAYNFFNGSNWQSVIIEAEDHEPRYAQITDTALIADYEKALDEMRFLTDRGGVKTFYTSEYKIQKSLYARAWELYTIEGRDADAAAFYAAHR